MKYLCTFSRILLGIVFIVSGITKVIDPVGTGFVISEYFNALGLSFFSSLSVLVGVLQSVFELVLGVALIVGLQMRISSILTMLIMVFFTFFTLWTAIANPVQHCGCFGDAIRLTNWETFLKNVIFTPFSILLFLKRKHYAPISFKVWEWGAIGLFSVASILLAVYCYRHLPLIEFTGYKVGNNIPQAMTVPEGAPKRQYKTTLIYKKGSETKKLIFENLSNKDFPDESWTFVKSKTRVIHHGTIPEIPNLEVSTYRGESVIDSLLSIKGPLLILTIPYADKAQPKAFERAGALYPHLSGEHPRSDVPFIVISGASEEMTIATLQPYGITASRYLSDPKTIYTMVRANPGLMLLYDANVVAKWSGYDIPSYSEIKQLLEKDWELVSARSRIWGYLGVEISGAILILLLIGLCRIFRKSSKYHISEQLSPQTSAPLVSEVLSSQTPEHLVSEASSPQTPEHHVSEDSLPQTPEHLVSEDSSPQTSEHLDSE